MHVLRAELPGRLSEGPALRRSGPHAVLYFYSWCSLVNENILYALHLFLFAFPKMMPATKADPASLCFTDYPVSLEEGVGPYADHLRN